MIHTVFISMINTEVIYRLLRPAGAVAFAALAGFICGHILIYLIRKFLFENSTTKDSFTRHCKQPTRMLLLSLGVFIAAPFLQASEVSEKWTSSARHVLSIVIIFYVAALLIRSTHVFNDFLLERFKIDDKDNLQARKIHTQLHLFTRIIHVLVLIIAVGVTLMTFERIRQLGTSILASAGIAGIIIGVAAQRSLATLIAGIQIAITQPIRIDDVVIVEGEWGRIEEITLTYVVVRIWDLRRLILPITYFIEKPFQNWTRVSADILGTVMLYLDYTIDVEAVRKELERVLRASAHWDKKVWNLQVTNTTSNSVELRALMSAVDASTAWTLRCEVREKLIAFLQEHYPQSLPRIRAELTREAPEKQE